MRTITISGTEYWHVPDANIVVPAYDLFIDHFLSTAADGAIDTLTVDTVVYNSIFFNGAARFYFGENLKFNAALNAAHTASATTLTAYTFYIWCGVSRDGSQLPAVLFSENNLLSLIPDNSTPVSFCMESGGAAFEELDTTAIAIAAVTGDFATVWMGSPETIPATAKTIRVLPICPEDVYVDFLLQNGESRRWFLKIKKKSSTFNELTKFNTNVSFASGNEATIEVSDGENEDLTTLYIAGLQKTELDEINQLAVSRFVNINGHRAEIIRRSATILGNTAGGSFSIDVKNMSGILDMIPAPESDEYYVVTLNGIGGACESQITLEEGKYYIEI